MARALTAFFVVLLLVVSGCLRGDAVPSDPSEGADASPDCARDPDRDPSLAPVSLFAAMDASPEGVGIACDRLWVTTNPHPARLIAFNLDTRERVYDEPLTGQDDTNGPGQGLAVDGNGDLFVLGPVPPRIVRVTTGDPVTQDVWATFPEGTWPNAIAFAPGGDLFVTDYWGDLIYRITPDATVEPWLSHPWFTPAVFAGVTDIRLGINGIALMPGGEHLIVMNMGHPGPDGSAWGAAYRVPIKDDPVPEDVEVLTIFGPGYAPEAARFGSSGRTYVSFAIPPAVHVYDEAWTLVDAYVGPTAEDPTIVIDGMAEMVFDPERRTLIGANRATVALSAGLGANRALIELAVDDVDAATAYPTAAGQPNL